MRSRIRGFGAVLAVALAACGGADSGADAAADSVAENTTAPAAATAVTPAAGTIEATLTEWSIGLSQDSVAAGVFTINVRNTGTVPHAFQITGGGQDVATDRVAPGGQVSLSLDLVPGEYRVICPLDSAGVTHAMKGMETRLKVF